MPRPPSSGDRLYRILLRLFPAEFRGDFGADMRADFRDERAAACERGRRALARLWWRTVPGLLLTAARAWFDDLIRDASFALRTMRRSPGFTAAAVVMLALGTGANAAVFSVIDAVLLHSPFRDSARLVEIDETSGATHRDTLGIPVSHVDRLTGLRAFSGIGLFWAGNAQLTEAGERRRVGLECMTASMFDVLGAPPLLGRLLTVGDDRPGSDPVVVVSAGWWQQAFGGDPSIVGRRIQLNGTPTTIVGVMPPRFLGPTTRNSAEMWAPLGPALHGASPIGCFTPTFVNVLARLAPGVTLAEANQRLAESDAIADLPDMAGSTGAALGVESLDENRFGRIRTRLLALLAAVGCVLLIACANVANLQLERLLGRRAEIGVRLALGASRGRIVRQTLTEHLLLGLGGAVAGLAAARLTLPLVVSLVPPYFPHASAIALSRGVLWATLAMALGTSLVVGLIPAVQATLPHVMDDIRAGTRSIAGVSQWPRRVFVVGEIALAMALLVIAGLMVQTFLTLRPTHPGFDPSHKIAAHVALDTPSDGANSADERNRLFVEGVMARLGRVPGISHASGTTYLPLAGYIDQENVVVEGARRWAWISQMTPDYLRQMQIPIVGGRELTDADTRDAPAVAIVNEQAARTFWPGTSALGRAITLADPDGTRTDWRVVGVARDTRSLEGDTRARPEVYMPYAQRTVPYLYFVMTTADSPDLSRAIRDAVSAERPGQLVDDIVNFDAVVSQSVAWPRSEAWLFGAFGAMAIGLGALGLAAVVGWWVTQRTREIGLRVALGALPKDVTRLVVRQALALSASGIVLGLALAACATKLVASELYGVTPFDTRTFAASAAAMLAITALASYLPARRAARIDPIVTLRAE